MNHQIIYDKIIHFAKFANRIKLKKTDINYIYFEKHHIIPRCLNGSNEENNLVLLTAREHFICHKLLTYIYKGNRKITLAFHRLTYGKNKLIISNRDYQYARELLSSTIISKETRIKIGNASKNRSRETLEKISKAAKLRIGEKNAFFGKKHNEETKQKLSKISKDYTKSKEYRSNMSIACLGEKNGMFGKHHSDETREKIKKSWEIRRLKIKI